MTPAKGAGIKKSGGEVEKSDRKMERSDVIVEQVGAIFSCIVPVTNWFVCVLWTVQTHNYECKKHFLIVNVTFQSWCVLIVTTRTYRNF